MNCITGESVGIFKMGYADFENKLKKNHSKVKKKMRRDGYKYYIRRKNGIQLVYTS